MTNRFWQSLSQCLKPAPLDVPLVLMLGLACCMSLLILYSAGNENMTLIHTQLIRMGLGVVIMLLIGKIPTHITFSWAPWFYAITCTLLVAVLIIGVAAKGAPRWISFGLFRFQPSELSKLSVPLMLAWYLAQHPMPPSPKILLTSLGLIFLPTLLVLIEPDLGTACMVGMTGAIVILLAGVSTRLIIYTTGMSIAALPILWMAMHNYQRQRILTFLDPQRDPLGSGYHIIQSKIAIGSGGLFGKGWLQGTQGHLHFLPEHTTDFIFSLFGEEFGFLGSLLLIGLFIAMTLRGLALGHACENTFARLLVTSLSLSFFLSMATNIAMVSGLLPVVGLPLPLISRGGTSLVTWMAFFGIIASINFNKNVLSTSQHKL